MVNRDKYISIVSIISAAWFIFIALMIHYIRPDLDVFVQTLSQYALGDYGAVLESGFFSIGLSQLLIAYILYKHNSKLRIVSFSLILSGAGVIIVGIFPAQPVTADLLLRIPHIAGATLQFVFFPIAVLIIGCKFTGVYFRRYTLMTGMLTAIIFFIILFMFVFDTKVELQYFGLIEKVNIFLIAFWLLFMSAKLRNMTELDY